MKRAFIAKCFLVHLVCLFIQLNTAPQGTLSSYCSYTIVYCGLVAFGVSTFLYRDVYFECNLGKDSIMLALPECLSTVILACILTGHAYLGVRVLLNSASIMAFVVISLTGLQWTTDTPTQQTNPYTESSEPHKLTTVQVV